MQTVKTAISIEKTLFEQTDLAARRLNLSRSRLVARALEEFLKKLENNQLLERIDDAYADAPSPAEALLAERRRQVHRRLVEGTW